MKFCMYNIINGGFQMSPIQQMFLGLGAATKTYAEDLFSTYLYRGNGSSQSINNGVKLSDGGLVWASCPGS